MHIFYEPTKTTMGGAVFSSFQDCKSIDGVWRVNIHSSRSSVHAMRYSALLLRLQHMNPCIIHDVAAAEGRSERQDSRKILSNQYAIMQKHQHMTQKFDIINFPVLPACCHHSMDSGTLSPPYIMPPIK